MFAEDEVLMVVERCVMVDMVEVSVVVETSDVVEVGVHENESVLFFFYIIHT